MTLALKLTYFNPGCKTAKQANSRITVILIAAIQVTLNAPTALIIRAFDLGASVVEASRALDAPKHCAYLKLRIYHKVSDLSR